MNKNVRGTLVLALMAVCMITLGACFHARAYADREAHSDRQTDTGVKLHNDKEKAQNSEHETSDSAHASRDKDSGGGTQPSAGSKGRSSGQAVETMKAEDWKPTPLDRLSADAEGKAAGEPLPEELPEPNEILMLWAAGIFGISAVLSLCTLALFNFKRYRKED